MACCRVNIFLQAPQSESLLFDCVCRPGRWTVGSLRMAMRSWGWFKLPNWIISEAKMWRSVDGRLGCPICQLKLWRKSGLHNSLLSCKPGEWMYDARKMRYMRYIPYHASDRWRRSVNYDCNCHFSATGIILALEYGSLMSTDVIQGS